MPIGPGGAVGSTSHTITLSGDFVLEAGFNLNGIDATKNGKTLVAVQSVNGKLFRIDPATGVTREISLGGESVPTGDGILLKGKRLYVVQNTMNRVAVISLASNLASGRLLAPLSDPDFSRPDHDRRPRQAPVGGQRPLRGAEPGFRAVPGRPHRQAEGEVIAATISGTHTGATWFRRGRFSGRAASRGPRSAS